MHAILLINWEKSLNACINSKNHLGQKFHAKTIQVKEQGQNPYLEMNVLHFKTFVSMCKSTSLTQARSKSRKMSQNQRKTMAATTPLR